MPHQFVAQVIAAAMVEREVTVAMLSDATGIPAGQLRDRLAGHPPFTIAELERIAGILGTRPSQMLERAVALQESSDHRSDNDEK